MKTSLRGYHIQGSGVYIDPTVKAGVCAFQLNRGAKVWQFCAAVKQLYQLDVQ